jgi:hypothetical protein
MESRTPSHVAPANGPLHRYAVVRRAGELSAEIVRSSTGTPHALLARTIDSGLVVAGQRYLQATRTRRARMSSPVVAL